MATLQFKGKSAVWNHHLSVPYHTLEKDAKKSFKGADAEENLIIEGDNLLALKSLLPKYQGRIKCIYIDPPYNTGKEGWIFNDNVNSPTIRDWVGKVVGQEGEDLTRHDKWLCMMTPRLKLLWELLADDGVFFVSLDDNELYNGRIILNEIFDEKNFVQNFMWLHGKGKKDKYSRTLQQYILCYAKRKESLQPWVLLKGKNYTFENPDNDLRGPWFSGSVSFSEERSNKSHPNYYKITSPSGIIWERQWQCSEDEMKEYLSQDKIYFGPAPKYENVPRLKIFPTDEEEVIPPNIFDDVGTTRQAQKHLDEIFGKNYFENPKPVELIKRLIGLSTNEQDIILDSFAGSGTTAESVIELNAQEKSKRTYILVQLPEEIKKDTPAYKDGFRWVHEITRERVKRVIAKNKYKTGFTYYTLGSSIDAESILTGKLPTYKEFAKYVYYLATGKNHPDEKKIKEDNSFVGKTDHQSVYLVYEKNADALKKLAITLDWAQKTHKKDTNKKIVYAPACYLDDEALEQFNIKFVSIPYNLFERAT